MVANYLIILLTISGISLKICADSCKGNSNSIIGSGVTKENIKVIIKKHNDVRASVAKGKLRGQPKGNIPNLAWDNELAKKAQDVADYCVFEHKNIEDSRWAVGQNIFMQKSTDKRTNPMWAVAILSWLNENKVYKYSPFASSSNAGHYTQLIWASTKKVGCGFTAYETQEQMKYHRIYVCNYGPGGNTLGQFPYKKN